MASPSFSDKKLEQYKTVLKRDYWELHEAAYFLSGSLDLGLRYSLDEETAQFLKTESFGLAPSFGEALDEDAYTQIVEKIYTAIQKEKIRARSFKLDKGIWRNSCLTKKHSYLAKHTYFLPPDDAIAIAVTEGIQLPFELQIASNLYQTKKPTKAKKGGWKNETRREALAQIYWYENPQGTIQGSVKNAFLLKMLSRKEKVRCKTVTTKQMTKIDRRNFDTYEREREFEFVNGNGENTPKNRGRIKNIRPSNDLLPTIPGVMIKKENHVAFDFMNLKVVLETIADYLCFYSLSTTPEELLSHPLIQMYSQEGGTPLSKITEFSLKETLQSLHFDDTPPEF
jgi:hypothetical protein